MYSFRSQHTPPCPADWKAARISGSSVKGREREEVAIATPGGCRFYWRKKISSAYLLSPLTRSIPFLSHTFLSVCVLISSSMSAAWDVCTRRENSSHVGCKILFLLALSFRNLTEVIASCVVLKCKEKQLCVCILGISSLQQWWYTDTMWQMSVFSAVNEPRS